MNTNVDVINVMNSLQKEDKLDVASLAPLFKKLTNLNYLDDSLVASLLELFTKHSNLAIKLIPLLLTSLSNEDVTYVLSSFFNDNNHYVKLSDIAEIAQRTPQATLSMIKSNEDSFPKPLNICGTNIYPKMSVNQWLINNNKIARSDEDKICSQHLIGTNKTAIIVGGPGNGKSTIAMGFAHSSVVKTLKKIFTSGGSADTENHIMIHLSKVGINYVVFHYPESANDTIPIEINEKNISRIKVELEKSKEKAMELRSKDDEESKKELAGTYVELVLKPNDAIQLMMNRCNIDILTVIDTPGIDSDHVGESVSSADVVLVALGDRNNTGIIAKSIRDNIIPKTGTAKYIYLYNNRYSISADFLPNEKCLEIYNENLNNAKEELVDYQQDLKELQTDYIIGSTLSACKPMDSLICVPSFSLSPDKTDMFFYTQLGEKLEEAFNNTLYLEELNAFPSDNTSYDFFIKIMKEQLDLYRQTIKGGTYNVNTFISEKHGRTKSLDNYRIENIFNHVISDLKFVFFDNFKKYRSEDYSDNKAAAIRLAYLTINEGIMNKVQYGKGYHPWEDINSPTQMICEEVLSDFVYNESKESYDSTYCEILSNKGIKSYSWNWVLTENTDWNKAKLLINSEFSFHNFNSLDLGELIKYSHFLPSILVQFVLSYKRQNETDWKSVDFENIYKPLINQVI